jgi:putative toxin-antitoxin system antitoxin component (TIGR02293 family)
VGLKKKVIAFDNKDLVRRNAELMSARATEVFGNRDKALRWLQGTVPSLGHRTPASLLATTEGIAEVQDTLGAIEHGIW